MGAHSKKSSPLDEWRLSQLDFYACPEHVAFSESNSWGGGPAFELVDPLPKQVKRIPMLLELLFELFVLTRELFI